MEKQFELELTQDKFNEVIDNSSTLNLEEKKYWKDSFDIMNSDQLEFLLRWI